MDGNKLEIWALAPEAAEARPVGTWAGTWATKAKRRGEIGPIKALWWVTSDKTKGSAAEHVEGICEQGLRRFLVNRIERPVTRRAPALARG